ncbi:MAG: tRNA pseudouridine(55) synthase TruB [Bacillota bacterium]|jgi:tRNA pseudouridine55 synthase
MDGFLNVLKNKGLTSHDVVLGVRRIFGQRKAGHLGTLDPMAQGVLPVALGSYRRLAEYLLDEDKDYLAEFIFGVSTDTGDLDGQVISRAESSYLTSSRVRELLPRFTGEIKQIPPAYSAVQVDGQRLHKLARQGITVDVPARDVRVYEFKLLNWRPGPYSRGIFSVRVGRGTYVRSLAEGLGDALGCGAAVSYLLRTRVGSFLLKDAVLLESLKTRPSSYRLEDLLASPVEVFKGFPLFEIRQESLGSVKHGIPLKPDDFVNPGAVMAHLERLSKSEQDRHPVLIGTYKQPYSQKESIACVLSPDNACETSCRIKYEKVLIQEE